MVFRQPEKETVLIERLSFFIKLIRSVSIIKLFLVLMSEP